VLLRRGSERSQVRLLPRVPIISNSPTTAFNSCAYYGANQGANLCRYSIEVMNALTISAFTKLPLNWFSLPSQKL